MRTSFHRSRIGAAPAILILLATGCDSAIVQPERPEDQFSGAPRAPEDPVTPLPGEPSGTPVLASRMAFTMCLEWGMDASFQDVCTMGGIVIREPDGSEERVLEESAYYADDPAWSPDGSRIAFTGHPNCDSADPGPCVRDIYVMNADGSSVARLTSSSGAGSMGPAWTPDGRRIAYVALTHDSTGTFPMGLRVMNADGSGTAALGDLAGANPAWSPDGTQLAFSAWKDGRSMGIYVADADGSNPRPLTRETGDRRPSWSPDGRSIAFTRSRAHADGSGSCEIYVMNADGSNPFQLTEDFFCAHNAAWSPDGATIAYNGIEGEGWGFYGIKLVKSDGTAARLIRPTMGWPSRVAWEPVP